MGCAKKNLEWNLSNNYIKIIVTQPSQKGCGSILEMKSQTALHANQFVMPIQE